MIPLSYTDYSIHPTSINEITHNIHPDTIRTSWTQQNIDPHTTHKTCNYLQPKIKSSLLMSSDIQVYKQVPLNNTNISE